MIRLLYLHAKSAGQEDVARGAREAEAVASAAWAQAVAVTLARDAWTDLAGVHGGRFDRYIEEVAHGRTAAGGDRWHGYVLHGAPGGSIGKATAAIVRQAEAGAKPVYILAGTRIVRARVEEVDATDWRAGWRIAG